MEKCQFSFKKLGSQDSHDPKLILKLSSLRYLLGLLGPAINVTWSLSSGQRNIKTRLYARF